MSSNVDHDRHYTTPPAGNGPPFNAIPVPMQVPMNVTPLHMLRGEAPQWIDCPFCHTRAKTVVRKEGTAMQM